MAKKCFPHDSVYKTIFSEKALISSLLLDFVKLPFVADFDFNTLALFPANYSTPAYKKYAHDLVWSVRLNDRTCLIFLMLEFQSRSEKWMAARIANYALLLLTSLTEHPLPGISLMHGLPPILPILIYNGHAPWRAATSLSSLFMEMPAALKTWQPQQEYYLLDIKHLDQRLLNGAHGESSFFFRLERSKSTAETLGILREIINSCQGPRYDRFRRLLHNFILCCLQQGRWEDNLEKPMPTAEFELMYENYPEWATAERREGIKEGRREGIKEGRKEERNEIFSEFLNGLKAKLLARFGKLPDAWQESLNQITDPARIMDLTGAIYTAKSAEEFEAQLLGTNS